MKITIEELTDAATMGRMESIRDSMVEAVKAKEHVFVFNRFGEEETRLVNVVAIDLYLVRFGRKA